MRLSLQRSLSLACIGFLVAIIWLFAFPFFGTQENVLADLSGNWESCSPKSRHSPCDGMVQTRVPSESPAIAQHPQFNGWLRYRTTFEAPRYCLGENAMCSLLIGELGDAVEAQLNGVAIGRHGDFPPNATYAKHYAVKWDLSRDLLRDNGPNELVLTIYSLKRSQSGLTRGPVAILPSTDAFRLERSINVRTVMIPIFGSVVLLFIAILTLMLLNYHNIQDKLSLRYLIYCIAASAFLFSMSESIREYVPIDLAGYAHFLLRTTFDWSHFALASAYFFPRSSRIRKLGWLYGIPVLLFFFCCIVTLLGVQVLPHKNGFDTALIIMRCAAPLVFLPVAVGLCGALVNRKNEASNLLVIAYSLLMAAQLFDMSVFHGFIRGFYFCKFYPMPLAVLFGYLLTSKYQVEHQKRIQENELRHQTNQAVAQMTGMLAHDVRKPFSILRMGLGMLGSAKDPASVRRVLSRLVPEIDKAVSSVDGLIADVMEVGSTSTKLIQEPASPESLIEATLGEIFRVYPNSTVRVNYDLKHFNMVNVHVQKVGRVLSNIVGNALQAMNYKGEIWFKTREHESLVEFCIGNAGSVIPADSLPKLFDAFFTSGKKGGTGLGLAIAQKVVAAHGGKIWCESAKTLEHPDGKVEFFFTLPVAKGHSCKSTATLPRHSSEIIKALRTLAATTEGEGLSMDKGELTLEADIIQAQEYLGRPLRVLVVDDEPIYRKALASYLNRTPELRQAIAVVLASQAEEALSAAATQTFDLVITDVDMGPASRDGFEVVRELRAKGIKALVCVHSNRIVAVDHATAFAAGASAFLPKPMARAQLLRLVLQAAENKKSDLVVQEHHGRRPWLPPSSLLQTPGC